MLLASVTKVTFQVLRALECMATHHVFLDDGEASIRFTGLGRCGWLSGGRYGEVWSRNLALL